MHTLADVCEHMTDVITGDIPEIGREHEVKIGRLTPSSTTANTISKDVSSSGVLPAKRGQRKKSTSAKRVTRVPKMSTRKAMMRPTLNAKATDPNKRKKKSMPSSVTKSNVVNPSASRKRRSPFTASSSPKPKKSKKVVSTKNIPSLRHLGNWTEKE